MHRLKLRYIVLLVTFSTIFNISASALPVEKLERGVILVISSYNPDTRRMSSFTSEFEQRIVESGIPCDISIENLECKGVADAPIWMKKIDVMLDRYEHRNLKAVVLLGQEAWASFLSLGRITNGVHFFGCYVSSNGIMLPFDNSAANKEWMPESADLVDLADSIGDGGGLVNHYDIDSNIKLITSLYPEVDRIAFLSDNSYGGISLQALARKEFAKHDELELVLIDARNGEAEAKKTIAELSARSVLLIGTWRVGGDGEYFMQSSLADLVNTNPNIPVFSLTGTGIGAVAIGGYTPKYENGASIIASQIVTAHRSGISQPYFVETANQYVFDAKKLKESKIPEYSLPKGSIVEDTTAAKLMKYSHYLNLLIIFVSILVIILIAVIVLYVRTRQLKKLLERREAELVVAKDKAEESDRLKSAFLANMSHEIRTPMNAIVGFSSLMDDEDLSREERADYCKIVVNNSEMLLTLLNDILDISSLECGKIKFSFADADIVQICQNVILTTEHTRKEGVVCRFEPPCESYMILTDIHRLSQVLINLLTNAGKFTTEGKIEISFNINENENRVEFAVFDTGAGIPVEKQDQVFNRFEKLNENKKGTGLGLAICRQIVMTFGGNIWVDKSYNAGAKFVFWIPINRKADQ